ncbi:MAG: SPFH domain-containing protein [Bacilli bacterium]|nr:SPFH domain-containing protein [Bacilli bacterium]
MGLIKAVTSSISSTLGDQFKEFVTCPENGGNYIIQRGYVQHGKGNRNPQEGILSKGTAIAVPEGMSMMVIDNGQIVEFTAEPGVFVFDNSTEPSIFAGNFGQNLIESIKTIGSRITFGGQTAKDQRVYYINTKRIAGNKFGSPQPKKITDEKYGMLEVTFNGEFVFQVEDPAVLVKSVVGSNPKDALTIDDIIGSQLKSLFVEKLTLGISEIMRVNKVSFGDMGLYGSDLSKKMNELLNDSWKTYGLALTDVAIRDINLTDESMRRVNKIDDAQIFSNANLQSGLMASATADAMQAAASNGSGSMMGFMGMNMAQNAGATVMGVANQNAQAQAAQEFCPDCGTPRVGNFCTNCGKKLN